MAVVDPEEFALLKRRIISRRAPVVLPSLPTSGFRTAVFDVPIVGVTSFQVRAGSAVVVRFAAPKSMKMLRCPVIVDFETAMVPSGGGFLEMSPTLQLAATVKLPVTVEPMESVTVWPSGESDAVVTGMSFPDG